MHEYIIHPWKFLSHLDMKSFHVFHVKGDSANSNNAKQEMGSQSN